MKESGAYFSNMESNGESVTFAETEMIMNLARFTDEQQHLGIDVGDWICRFY